MLGHPQRLVPEVGWGHPELATRGNASVMRLKLEVEEKKQAMVLLQRALVRPPLYRPGGQWGNPLPAPYPQARAATFFLEALSRHLPSMTARTGAGPSTPSCLCPLRHSSVTSLSGGSRKRRRS